jgi:hypothetical protein
MVDGDQQVAVAGARVPDPLIVRLLDPAGNPIPDRTVLWVVKAGGGSITPTTGMTDAQGYASAEWTLGPSPGPDTVEAQVPDVGSVTFSAVSVTSTPTVDHLVFSVEPSPAVGEHQTFHVEVSLVDADGAVVPLSGIFIYLGLFREGAEHPSNDDLGGERFENTTNGVAAFDLSVESKGRFSLRALTDDLPELGPHGPEPYLFSQVFEVE